MPGRVDNKPNFDRVEKKAQALGSGYTGAWAGLHVGETHLFFFPSRVDEKTHQLFYESREGEYFQSLWFLSPACFVVRHHSHRISQCQIR